MNGSGRRSVVNRSWLPARVGVKNRSPVFVGATLVVALFLFRILIGEDDKVGKVDVSISVEVKVTLIAGVAPVQAKVLDE